MHIHLLWLMPASSAAGSTCLHICLPQPGSVLPGWSARFSPHPARTTAPTPTLPVTLQDKDTCWPVHTPIRYYLSAYGKLDAPGPEPMMNEIFHRGPITCSIATHEAFDYGRAGVGRRVAGKGGVGLGQEEVAHVVCRGEVGQGGLINGFTAV